MKSLLTSFILLLVVLSGCSQPAPQSYKTPKPKWISNPSMDGNIGAIGIASRTYDQKESTKRKIAIARALDELTLQQGVKVEMSMTKRDVSTNESSSTLVDVKSAYEASSTVTAHIEQVWENPLSGELFIWMVMD
ncbi:MAG: hypothetical protein U9Q29_04675 [Campylobacterota bacterium]|nr:hypothetical protein [Campylobacterota bacterium]